METNEVSKSESVKSESGQPMIFRPKDVKELAATMNAGKKYILPCITAAGVIEVELRLLSRGRVAKIEEEIPFRKVYNEEKPKEPDDIPRIPLTGGRTIPDETSSQWKAYIDTAEYKAWKTKSLDDLLPRYKVAYARAALGIQTDEEAKVLDEFTQSMLDEIFEAASTNGYEIQENFAKKLNLR